MGKKKQSENGSMENVVTREKQKGIVPLLILLAIAVIVFAVLVIGFVTLGDKKNKFQDQLDLGEKYLDEMDYEKALVAFEAILDIDPKNADAYLGIVEVYIRTSEFEKALAYAQEGYEVTGDERLKEKIKMIESGTITASNGRKMKLSGFDGDGNLVYWHEYTYNLKGKQASVAVYNAQGEQKQYLELTYDEEDRPMISYGWDSMEGTISKREVQYGDNHKRQIYYEGLSDIVARYAEIDTDSDGNVLKTVWYDADGNVTSILVYEYDSEGNQTKKFTYNEANELMEYSVFTCGKRGEVLKEQKYNSDGDLLGYYENDYDEKGHQISIRSYNADGVLEYEMKK